MEIRRASIDDLDKLSVIFDLYRVFAHQASDITAGKQFLSDRIQQNQSVIFIAVSDNEIVGFTQLYPIFSSVGLTSAWLLNDLYVKAEVRQQGVAKRLLNLSKEFCKESNAAWLLLQTANDNYTAQEVYQKNGWEKVSDFFYMFRV